MFPISDDNPTLRTPVVTYLLLLTLGAVWFLVQGAGFNEVALAASICELGMISGELTGQAQLGTAVPIGGGFACLVDDQPINILTPLTSMFLHGGWGHILGNCLFLWVFGNNVEDSMGRIRFPIFYVLCGLIAAATHVLVDPDSPIPTVGASGAISGVMGAYLVLYPKVRVNLLVILFVFIRIIPVPAWVMLIYWILLQLVAGLPQLSSEGGVEAGVAFWAHIGGFFAGVLLVKPFENKRLVEERTRIRHRLHPFHP